MDSSHDSLLFLWESIHDAKDCADIPAILEGGAAQVLGVPCELELGDRGQTRIGTDSLVVESDDGRCLAQLRLLSEPGCSARASCDLLLKMMSWALQRGQLLRAARDRHRLLQELKVGRLILEESLPAPLLCTPHWHLAARLEPASHLGGDLYFYSRRPGYTRFLLADAVGHGLGSTLLASECRALWRGLADEAKLEGEVERLSRMLYEDTGESRFVAATLGRCYPNGTLDYAACGQGPCFLLREGELTALEETEPPLGLFEDQKFEEQRLKLLAGDTWICSSDGLLEWENESRCMFGVEGVAACLSGERELSAEQVVQRLFESVHAFHEPECPRDDTCVLALQFLG